MYISIDHLNISSCQGMMVLEMIIVLIYLTTVAADDSCQNCKDNKCDVNDKCVDGCKRGFAGDKCLHKCSTNSLDQKCELNVHTGNYPCLIGCTFGYHGYQCNAPCKTTDNEGKCDRYSGASPDCGGTRYGANCETSCLPNCNGSMCDNTGKCFRDVCLPGRYGVGCRELCESNCKLCHNNTGECLLFADKGEPESSKSSCEDQVREESVYFPVITALLVIIAIGVMFQTADICMRWKERSNTKTCNYISEEVCGSNQLTICSSSSMWTTGLVTNSTGSQADRYISKRDRDSKRLTSSSSGSTTELVTSSSSGIDTSSASQADRVKKPSNTKTAANYISKRDFDSKRLTSSSFGSTTYLVTSSSSGIDTSSASQADRGTDGEEMVCVSGQSRSSSSGFETYTE